MLETAMQLIYLKQIIYGFQFVSIFYIGEHAGRQTVQKRNSVKGVNTAVFKNRNLN